MRLSPWTSDQGQGLSRIMKSPISSPSSFLLHSMVAYGILYYPPLHSCATEHIQHNSGCNEKEALQIIDRKYRFVSPDTAVILILLSCFLFLLGYKCRYIHKSSKISDFL